MTNNYYLCEATWDNIHIDHAKVLVAATKLTKTL